MNAIGNRIANEFWEANLPADFERPDSTNAYQLSMFIRQKYVYRKWIGSGPEPGKQLQPGQPVENGKSGKLEARIERSSSSNEDLTIQDIFGPEKEGKVDKARMMPKPGDGVSSATRRPGKKIPERLARKLRSQEKVAPTQKDSEDPFV
jgi:stromal membrane-associated protein